jgi:hypothetical protein
MRLIMLCILANNGYDVKALDDAVVNADIPAEELYGPFLFRRSLICIVLCWRT